MRPSKRIFCIIFLFFSPSILALAIRSFVAMPIEQGGIVFRAQDFINTKTDMNNVVGDIGYGIANKHAIFLRYPEMINAVSGMPTQDVSLLYRYTFLQKDNTNTTFRIALLSGGFVPTNSGSDGGLKGGFVTSYFKGRNEFDGDVLYDGAFGSAKNYGNYDLSWQYRIYPAKYSEWGLGSSVNTVLEYTGQWMEKANMAHQATLGLQWVMPQLILEGGLIKDLNQSYANIVFIGLRVHI